MYKRNQRWEEMDNSGTSLQALFDTYSLYNRSEGRATSTIRWYEDKLRGFLRWLEQNGYPADLGGFTSDRVREFVLHLQDKEERWDQNPYTPTQSGPLSGHTIHGYVRTLKAFASWLCEEGLHGRERAAALPPACASACSTTRSATIAKVSPGASRSASPAMRGSVAPASRTSCRGGRGSFRF